MWCKGVALFLVFYFLFNAYLRALKRTTCLVSIRYIQFVHAACTFKCTNGPDGGSRCGAAVRFAWSAICLTPTLSIRRGNQTQPIHTVFPRRVFNPYMLLRVLLDADCAMGARAQPQINPLRATENPHSVIMTGLLGTLASSTAWKAWLSRCSWHRRVRFACVRDQRDYLIVISRI